MTTAGSMMMLDFMVNKVGGKALGRGVNTAPGRVVVFGVFAALADVVRNAFKDRVVRANKNIESIDKAITTWTNATKGGSVTGGSGGDDPTTNTTLALANNKSSNYLKRLGSVPKLGKCFSVSAQVDSNSCKRVMKFNRGLINFRSSFLNGTANQALGMGEAFARDDGAGASTIAAGLGSAANAARVKAEAKGLIAEANAALMRSGGRAIDFDKQVKAQLASFGKDGLSGSGSGSASAGSGTRASLDEDDMESESVSSSVAVSAPGAIGQPAADLAFPIDEGITTEPIVEAKADQSLDDFESSVQDVAKKDDVSIFKQLSNRYILNYKNIFDTKKAPEAVPEEPKKN
jgi:hypothetical protein